MRKIKKKKIKIKRKLHIVVNFINKISNDYKFQSQFKIVHTTNFYNRNIVK